MRNKGIYDADVENNTGILRGIQQRNKFFK